MRVDGEGQGDLARDLLRTMQARARRSPVVRTGSARPGPLRRPYGSEPLLLAELARECMAGMGWRIPGQAMVRARWTEIMGPDIGAHLVPERLDERSGVLHLAASSKAWASQVQFLERLMLQRLRHELGDAAPRALRITVQGPSGGRLSAVGPRFEEPTARAPVSVAGGRPSADEEGEFPEISEEEFAEVFPESAFPDAALAEEVTDSGPVDQGELVHGRLREQLAHQRAEEDRRRRGREDVLRLPSGWLDGPAGLNPGPPPEPGRARWACAVLASARLRAAADRTVGGAE